MKLSSRCLGFIAVLCHGTCAYGQSDSALAASEFPKAYMDAFTSLLDEKFPNPAASRDLLCRKLPDPRTAKPEEFKAAFIKTSVDLTTSIVFSSKKSPSDNFTFDVDFLDTGLFLKHSRPRRSADYAGLRVPPPRNWVRYLLYRGAGGTDIVVMIPSLQECSVRGVVLCPRILTTEGITKPTDYEPTSIEAKGHAEAEGIFAVDAGQQATTAVEIKATEGVPLPVIRTKSTTATSAIANLKLEFPETSDSKTTLPVPSLPAVSALEAIVRFTKASKEGFEFISRSEITVSEFEVKATKRAQIDEGLMYLSPGKCFVLMKRMDTLGKKFTSD